MDEKKNNPRSHSNAFLHPDPAQILEQAEQKAKDIPLPDLDTMSREEIQQQLHELQVKQIKAELENEQLRNQLEENDDHAALFKIVTENMLDMVTLTDMEGNFTFAGKAHEILGYEPGFLIGKNVMDFVHPEDLPRILKELNEFVASVQPRKIDYRYRCQDGSYLWLETVGNFIKDENGAPQKIIFNSRDITESKQAGQDLFELSERYRLANKATNDVIWDWDVVQDTQRWNEAGTAVFGWTEIVERPVSAHWWVDRVHSDDLERVHESFFQVVNSPELDVWHDEYRFRKADGDYAEVVDHGYVLRDERGKAIRMIGAMQDITERKRAEEQLRISEEKYRNIFENMQDVYYETSLDGLILEISPSIEAISGGQYRPTDLIGRQMLDFYDDAQDRDRLITKLLETGSFSDCEVLLRNRDGSLLPCSISAKLWRDDQGNPVKILGSMRDTIERKESENALRKSENKYKLLANNTIDCIWVLNMDLVFTYINPAIEPMMGYTPDEWIGTRLSDHCTHERFEHMGQLVMEAIVKLPDDFPIFFETEMLSKDGRSVPLEILSRTITDADGNPIALQGVTRDITERKKAETEREKLREQLRQAQKMESVGRLAGGVAHDYNNMLSVILGYTEMAMDQVDPKDQLYADLKEVYNAGKRSMEITGQLLAFARKQIISPVVMDLNEAVDGMLKMLRRLIGEDIDFAWGPAIRLWRVNMDPSQLDQILANLCVNARDAISGVGKITIETENVCFDESYCAEHAGFIPGEFVMLAFSDNGCGMDKETMAQIFEPFFTTKEIGKGTGLGLATVYGIVKQNNGFINCYSEPGNGTTFRIYLPRHAIGTDEAIAEVTPEEVVFGQGETLLLVEDEPAIIKMCQAMLEKLGYNVLIAHAPDEAVKLASEHSGMIHLLMSDVIMPGMNGRDLADKLKAIRPDIRVLFMSGYTADVIVHHGVLDEGEHFIQKPFSMKKLSVKVREALKGGKSS